MHYYCNMVLWSTFPRYSFGTDISFSCLSGCCFRAGIINIYSCKRPVCGFAIGFNVCVFSFILSGFIFEINSMPKWIQLLTHLFAARYFVTSLQTLFLTGNIWSLLIRCLFAIALIGFAFFFITAHKTRKRLD